MSSRPTLLRRTLWRDAPLRSHVPATVSVSTMYGRDVSEMQSPAPDRSIAQGAEYISAVPPRGVTVTEIHTDSGPATSPVEGSVHVITRESLPKAGSHRSVDTEQLVAVIAGIATVGEACDVLRKAGWSTRICANRITVNDEICIHFLGLAAGSASPTSATWVIYQLTRTLSDDIRG